MLASSTTTGVSEPLLSNRDESNVTVTVTTTEKKQVHSRLLALDLFRGVIIMIMAWDHTTHPFTNDHDRPTSRGGEIWEGPYNTYDNAPRKFLSRVVSHICAPGFFLTMGMSLIFFTASRREKLGWSWQRVFKHHFTRGVVLLLIEYVKSISSALPKLVDIAHGREVIDWRGNDYHKGDEGKVIYQSTFGINEVMTALGFTMILSQFAMPLFFLCDNRRKGGAELLGVVLFLVSFALSNIAIVLGQGDADLSNPPNEYPHFPAKVTNPLEFIGRVLFYPGELFVTWEALLDPVFPWIGITFLGMGLGFGLRRSSTMAYKHMLYGAMFLFAAFLCVRGFGGPLNYRGNQRGEDLDVSALMAFFIQTKYPPDWAYACITLCASFLVIYLFSSDRFADVETKTISVVTNVVTVDAERQVTVDEAVTPTMWQRFTSRVRSALNNPLYPLLVFGRTPMFFYVIHVWIIQIFDMMFRIPKHPGGQFPLFPGVFLMWVVLMLVTYQLCVRYMAFKSKTDPDSLWRLF